MPTILANPYTTAASQGPPAAQPSAAPRPADAAGARGSVFERDLASATVRPRLQAPTGEPTPPGAEPAGDARSEKRMREIRKAAEQLVASTFIMPMFNQLRQDPLAANLFHGGRGESVFQQQLDTELSDRIAAGTGFDLVEAVVKKFSAIGEDRPPPRGPGAGRAVIEAQKIQGAVSHG